MLLARPQIILIFLFASYAAGQIKISDGTEINFGTIYNTSRLISKSVILKNTGKSTLVIKGVRTSCGCTVAKISDSLLARGRHTIIHVTFNPEGYLGKVSKFIHVFTTDPLNPTITIRLTGTIATVLQSSPPYISFRGSSFGAPDTVRLLLTNVTSAPVRILKAVSEYGDIKITLGKDKLGKGESTTLILRRQLQRGSKMSGYIRVMTTSKLQPVLQIRVFHGFGAG
ncbi:MAG TPA: DUF1573 domain-containing protein [Candidatus Kryptonia bacterium]